MLNFKKQIDQLVYKLYGFTPACPELAEGKKLRLWKITNMQKSFQGFTI